MIDTTDIVFFSLVFLLATALTLGPLVHKHRHRNKWIGRLERIRCALANEEYQPKDTTHAD